MVNFQRSVLRFILAFPMDHDSKMNQTKRLNAAFRAVNIYKSYYCNLRKNFKIILGTKSVILSYYQTAQHFQSYQHQKHKLNYNPDQIFVCVTL